MPQYLGCNQGQYPPPMYLYGCINYEHIDTLSSLAGRQPLPPRPEARVSQTLPGGPSPATNSGGVNTRQAGA